MAGRGYTTHHCRESQPTGSPGMMMMHEPGMPRRQVLRAGTQVAKGPRWTQQWGQKSDLAPSSPEMAPKRSSIASIHPSPLPIWVTSVLWLAVSSTSHPSLWPQAFNRSAVFGGRSKPRFSLPLQHLQLHWWPSSLAPSPFR